MKNYYSSLGITNGNVQRTISIIGYSLGKVTMIILFIFSGIQFSVAQCTVNYWGNYGNLTPICGTGSNGAWASSPVDSWTVEYSIINVNAGSTYEFQTFITSNNAARFGTVSTTSSTPLVWGITSNSTSLTWLATFTGQVHFYTFNNSSCIYSTSI